MAEVGEFTSILQDAGRVHIDGSVIERHLAASPRYVSLTRAMFDGLRRGDFQLQSSTMSLADVLVRPYVQGREGLAERATRYLTALPNFEWIPVSAAIARQAAQVRAQLGQSPERAIQIATALSRGAHLFLTERSGLRRIAGMRVATLDGYARMEGAGT